MCAPAETVPTRVHAPCVIPVPHAQTQLSQPQLHCPLPTHQPRRISAISLAERVAFERCEEVGGTVGHFVRLDTSLSSATRLLFCTTGVLLRQLTSDAAISGITHVGA